MDELSHAYNRVSGRSMDCGPDPTEHARHQLAGDNSESRPGSGRWHGKLKRFGASVDAQPTSCLSAAWLLFTNRSPSRPAGAAGSGSHRDAFPAAVVTPNFRFRLESPR